MHPSPRRPAASIPSLVCLLLAVGAAWAAEIPGRVTAPPQLGFQPGAPEAPAYAPDRVLDKLTDQSRRASRVPASWRYREELAGGVTGLAAVDRVLGDGGVRAIRRALIEPANVAEAERLGVGRWLMVELSSPRAAEIVERLSRLHEVEAATLDYRAFPAVVPLDPLHSIHWGHNNTAQMLSYNWTNQNHETGSPVGRVRFDANAEAAWDGTQGYGSNSVIIAIIDSGVEADHPDVLQVAGYDFGDNDPDPDDNCSPAPPCGGRGHGTACAGIAAARTNGLGTAGIAAGCRVMPLKVANSSCCIYYTPLANAIMYAADHGANIISMSLGAAISNHGETDAAIDYAYNAGCTILAATGNENASTVLYPAIHANVIGVGAASPCGERKRSSSNPNELNPGVYPDPNGYTCDGERFWGSNYGSTTKDAAGAVDVIAPTILPTTDLQGSAGYSTSDYYKWFNGTSCATPYAAGVCALIKSANSTWTPAQIRDRLLTTAQDVVSVESGAGWDRYAGHGMVDAAAAVGVNVAFTDVTVEANVVTTDVGPAAWEDFDNDGDLDLFVAEGPHRWYRNDGAGHFTPFSVTSESYGAFVGVAVGDFTGDGFSDVYVVGTIDNENELFRNTGAGGFLRMATYGAPIGFGTGQDASWVDFDGDGDLDLYQTVNDIDLVANRLFRNDGPDPFGRPDYWSWTLVPNSQIGEPGPVGDVAHSWIDIDGDFDQDLFIANNEVRQGFPPTSYNRWLRNDGGQFTLVNSPSGPIAQARAQGVSWGDYDLDGDFDLYYPVNGQNVLIKFPEISIVTPPPLDDPGACGGASWIDYDNDRDMDLYILNWSPNNKLFRNNWNGNFTEVLEAGDLPGFKASFSGPSATWGDYDADGDLDVFVSDPSRGCHLLKNTGGHAGDANWLKVRLVGVQSNRSGIGAFAKVVGGGQTMRRQISGGGSKGSQDALTAHFGLGALPSVDQLEIRWPSGNVQTLNQVAANQELVVVECTGTVLSFPNGGEFVPSGGDLTVTWTPVSNPTCRTKADVSFSFDGGSTWPYTQTALPNTGSYTTQVGTTTNQLRVRVTAYDPAAASSDMSEANVTVWGIDNASTTATISSVCSGNASMARLSVNWNTTVPTGGTDKVQVWVPGGTTYTGTATPPGPSTSHSIVYDFPCVASSIVYQVTSTLNGLESHGNGRVITLASCASCGGGGHCPFLDTRVAGNWQEENSILGRSTTGEPRRDLYKLAHAPEVAADGTVRLRVREDEQERTRLAEAELLAVDHGVDQVSWVQDGHVVLGTRMPVARVRSSTGEDLTRLFTDPAGGGYEGKPGTILDIELYAAGTGTRVGKPGGVLIQPSKKEVGPDPGPGPTAVAYDARVLARTGIVVERPDGHGGWVEVSHLYPREKASDLAVSGERELRLVFVGRHRIHDLAWVRIDDAEPKVLSLAPIVAVHSSRGDVRPTLAAGRGAEVTVSPGERIEFAFQVPPVGPNQVRDYYFAARGVYTTLGGGGVAEGMNLPKQIELAAARPNPTNESVTIGFGLPVSAAMRISIFDIAGRLVSRPVDSVVNAGRHEMTWDLRSSSGTRVSAGLYFYRMEVGRWREERKLVVN